MDSRKMSISENELNGILNLENSFIRVSRRCLFTYAYLHMLINGTNIIRAPMKN